MKTRFLAAIIHALPGADFQSAAGESRRAFRMPQGALPACPRISRSPQCVAGATHHDLETSEQWRFASAWREKPVENSIPVAGRRRFFRCLTTGLASATILFAAGCKTDSFSKESSHAQNYSAMTNFGVTSPG